MISTSCMQLARIKNEDCRSAPTHQPYRMHYINSSALSLHVIKEAIRRLLVAPGENPPNKTWVLNQIPISKLIELSARRDDVGSGYRRRALALALAVRLEARGKIEVLDADQ